MTTIVKKIGIVVSMLLVLLNGTTAIHAEPLGGEFAQDDNFIQKIYQSESYEKYKNEIDKIYINKVVQTSGGIRRTVGYKLLNKDNVTRYIMYIGNDQSEIIDSLLASDNGATLSILDFDSDLTNKITYNPSERAYICHKDVCTSTSYKVNWHLTAGCSTIVGSPCSSVSIKKKSN